MCAEGRRASWSLLAGLLAALASAGASALDLGGYLGGELRGFTRQPAFAGQRRQDASLVAAPEFYQAWGDGEHALILSPFLRLDSADPRRNHVELREALYQWVGERWEARLGVGRVFWGVAESRHLVDVINQTDFVEDPDGEDKLGQPMASVAWKPGPGTLELFVLPGFRERTFAGPHGRLRGEPAVAVDRAEYESGARDRHVDLALRWSQTLGNVDLGLAHFAGTGREPRLVARRDASGTVVLVPRYEQIQQTSLDLQAATGAWLWKLEALHRTGQGPSHVAWVAGFERTTAGVAGIRADLGLLAEHLYDSRGARSPQPFENDLFLGLRLALNDAASSRLLAGVIHDLGGDGELVSVEASRRLGDRWTVELEARLWAGIAATDPQRPLARDDYVALRLLRYF